MSDLKDKNQESIELLWGGTVLVCYGVLCVAGAPILFALNIGEFCTDKIKKVMKKPVH